MTVYLIPSRARFDPKTGKPTNQYKAIQTKGTYDPNLLSDKKVADMSAKAATQAKSVFKQLPASRREVTVYQDGYAFRVTRSHNGTINNAFITIPPRVQP